MERTEIEMKMEKKVLCGNAISQCPLRGRCPKVGTWDIKSADIVAQLINIQTHLSQIHYKNRLCNMHESVSVGFMVVAN